MLNRAAHIDNTAIDETRKLVEQAAQERDELHNKVESASSEYGSQVNEIRKERALLLGQNKQQSKLVVTKALFTTLLQALHKRKQAVMNEFFSYCRFDERCHSRLTRFVKTIERLG